MTHDLKTWPDEFEALRSGRKTFEFRRDDREFAVGDRVLLREWEPVARCYTGRTTLRVITHLLRGKFGVPDGYVVLAIRRPGFMERRT